MAMNIYHNPNFKMLDPFYKIRIYNNLDDNDWVEQNDYYIYYLIYSFNNFSINFINLNNEDKEFMILDFINKKNLEPELVNELFIISIKHHTYNIMDNLIKKYNLLNDENKKKNIIINYLNNNKYDLLYKFIFEYKINFYKILIDEKFEISNVAINSKDINYILKIIDITDLIYLYEHKNYKYILFNNFKVNKKLFLKIINNLKFDNTIIFNFISHLININDNKTIEYILNHSYLQTDVMINMFFIYNYLFMEKINDPDIEDKLSFYSKKFNKYNFKFKQADILNSLVKYIEKYKLSDKIVISEHIYKKIVILPNIKTSKNFLLKHIRNLSEYCFRYMSGDIIHYFLEYKNINLDNFNNLNILENIILNKINNLTHYFLKKYWNRINNNDFNKYFNYNFINAGHISYQNKIKKIKILEKYYNIEYYYLLGSVFEKRNNTELKLWCLKKYINNGSNKIELWAIFEGILLEDDQDLLIYFLENYNIYISNYWYLIKYAIRVGYDWFHDFINLILMYCGDLKDETFELKQYIFEELLPNYNYFYSSNKCCKKEYKNNFNYKIYSRLINNFLKNGCKINNKILLNIKNKDIFKALIYNGFKYSTYFNKKIKTRYYYNYSFEKEIKNLYFIIKRIKFRRNYRNKKEHNKKYYNNIIDLKSRPPNKEVPVLSKGGMLFYDDMDEWDNLYETEGIYYKNPIHIEPIHLLELINKELVISQKVDGILAKNLEKEYIYPKISELYNNIIFDAEYIKELDLYLIFNLRAHSKIYNTYYDDFLELREEHYFYKNNTTITDFVINNLDNINNLLSKEISIIINFCEINPKKKKWLPKTFYKMNNGIINTLDVLKNIEKYHDNIYNNCIKNGNLEWKTYLDNKYLKTDGIIIYENNNKDKDIYKLKPKQLLTGDIKFDDTIYRCNYNKNSWEKVEIRLDKIYPNSEKLISKLEYYNNNYWNIYDIQIYLKKYNIIYYEKNEKLSYNNLLYFKFYKKYLNKIIKKNLISNKINNVIDLGCGFLNNELWKMDIKITGIDLDIKIINKYETINNKNKKLFIKNFTDNLYSNSDLKNYNKVELFYKKYFEINLVNNYDLIFMNMSIHNIFRDINKINTFIQNIIRFN